MDIAWITHFFLALLFGRFSFRSINIKNIVMLSTILCQKYIYIYISANLDHGVLFHIFLYDHANIVLKTNVKN